MGYSLVNILGGLLIVTSTMVVVSKTIPSAIKWYAIQSVVLVGVLLPWASPPVPPSFSCGPRRPSSPR